MVAGSRSDTEQPTASAMSISSSTVIARSPRSLRSTDWCDIPVLAAMLALLSPALATAARTSAATWFRVVLVFMWSTIVLNRIEVNRVDQIGSKWDDLGTGRGQLTGPATAYVAGELRAERARQGLTIDELAERSGVAKTTVNRALKGDTALAVEVLIPLCAALRIDLGQLLNEAARRR